MPILVETSGLLGLRVTLGTSPRGVNDCFSVIVIILWGKTSSVVSAKILDDRLPHLFKIASLWHIFFAFTYANWSELKVFFFPELSFTNLSTRSEVLDNKWESHSLTRIQLNSKTIITTCPSFFLVCLGFYKSFFSNGALQGEMRVSALCDAILSNNSYKWFNNQDIPLSLKHDNQGQISHQKKIILSLLNDGLFFI